MKVGIYGGEAFPIYEVYSNGRIELEVDEETIKRWREAFNQFSKVQQEIVNELKNQNKSDKVWANDIWNGFHLSKE